MIHNKKGAIELSANFIVVIVISIIIVVGGLAMFFKMQKNAQSYVSALDSQTEDRIKSMMLSGSDRLAIYPADFTLGANDAKLVGVGITNIHDGPAAAQFKIELSEVMIYDKDYPDGRQESSSVLSSYYNMTSNIIIIGPHEQKVKGVLIKAPKGSKTGQYVYTLKISIDDYSGAGFRDYGVLQVFVKVP